MEEFDARMNAVRDAAISAIEEVVEGLYEDDYIGICAMEEIMNVVKNTVNQMSDSCKLINNDQNNEYLLERFEIIKHLGEIKEKMQINDEAIRKLNIVTNELKNELL